MDPSLDRYLEGSLKYLKGSINPNKGVVSAALVSDDNVVYATSLEQDGEWVHAERNALQQFVDRYGMPSEDAAMVTSLSPCSQDMENRVGGSCTELLSAENNVLKDPISRIHSGKVDYVQVDNSDFYSERGFDFTLTDDSELQTACERLSNYFNPDIYGQVPIDDFVDHALRDID
jgi:pyrimidine deaminase RibD-like protein